MLADKPIDPFEPASYRRYFRWLLGSLVLGALGFLLLLRLQVEHLPPPPFTGSISFDEKALWLAKRLHDPVDILAIGSSMTLNNLSAEALGDRAVLNASSWGLKMMQTERFLDLLLEFVDPKMVLTVTTPTDFERDYRGATIYDEKRLRRFFQTGDVFQSHLSYLSLSYLLSNYRSVQRDRVGRQTYYSLDFDPMGCVPLADKDFEFVDKRWAMPLTVESAVDEANYLAVERIAARCAKEHRRFVLVQPPIRLDIVTESAEAFLTKHWAKLEAACSASGQRFINLHGLVENQKSYYADSTHLNRSGVAVMVKALLARDSLRAVE